MVIIQEIITEWTQKSRSGAAAARRNKTPKALPLPAPKELLPGDFPIHHVRSVFSEDEDFKAPKLQVIAGAVPSFQFIGRGFRLRPGVKGSLKVAFDWKEHCGAPRRPGRHLGTLQPGQWLRFEFNGRFGGKSEWSYHQTVLNIGLFATFDSDVFLRTSPLLTAAELARLW